jgi:hypothetical protein
LSQGGQKATYFWDSVNDVVVQAVACDKGSRVQAFKRLILAQGHVKKGVPIEQLHTILAAYNGSLEIATAAPDENWVKTLEPLRQPKRGVLESALRRTEAELAERESEFLTWKGVRDVDEAHENFKKRSEEIRDLNQRLYHIDREPQLIYNPGHPLRTTLSAWQTVGRFHLRELKDQAKERSSALRLRIDFTKRQAIKELKDTRKEILSELEDEEKREKDYAKTIAELVEEGLALSLAITVRSPTVDVLGRKDAVVRKCAEDVADNAKRLSRTLKEKLELDFRSGLPSWIGSFTGRPHDKALAGKEELVDEVAKVATATIEKVETSREIQKIGFPRFDASKRLAEDQAPTSLPVLYDLDALSRHVLIVGGTGSGKTQLARVLVESLLLQHSPIPVLIIDPTGSWTGLAQACTSSSMIERYEQFAMKKEWARPFPFQLLNAGEPAADIARKAVGFRGASVLVTNTLSSAEEIVAVRSLLQAVQAEIQTWPEGATRFTIVMDEAHKFLAEKGLNEVAQFLARTARVRGAGLIFISQNWTDVGDIRSNCQTKAQLSTGYGPDLVRASQVFGSNHRDLVPKLKQGCALLNYPEWRTALVQVRPSLSHPGAIPKALLEMHEAAANLEEIVATMTRHLTTCDATTVGIEQAQEKPKSGPSEPLSESSHATEAGTWRDVATSLANCDLSAARIAAKIRERGMAPPGVRTIQRFRALQKRNTKTLELP